MTDVIVIGAGGGGPVVAKELAARGLDVLVLEAGPRFADPENEWTHFEDDLNNPITGLFRHGPGDRSGTPWLRDLPQNSFVWQVSGVGGTTLHFFGNSPRAAPGVFSGYDAPTATCTTRRTCSPSDTTNCVPTTSGWRPRCRCRLPDGRQGAVVPAGSSGHGSATPDLARYHRGRPPRTAERDPPTRWYRRPHPRPCASAPSEARGCTMCGHCYQAVICRWGRRGISRPDAPPTIRTCR